MKTPHNCINNIMHAITIVNLHKISCHFTSRFKAKEWHGSLKAETEDGNENEERNDQSAI